MGIARTTTLWLYIEQGGKNRYVKIQKSGKSYVPNVQGEYKAGSFYLRYREGDKRKWERHRNDDALHLDYRSSFRTDPTAGCADLERIRYKASSGRCRVIHRRKRNFFALFGITM